MNKLIAVLFIFSIFNVNAQHQNLIYLDSLSDEMLDSIESKNFDVPDSEYISSSKEESGNYSSEASNNFKDSFFPIGWSEDGKFAYLLEPEAQNCECYFVEVYIYDLESNKTLWFKQYNNEENVAKRREILRNELEPDTSDHVFYPGYTKSFWYKNYTEISEQLLKYNIKSEYYNYRLKKDQKYASTNIILLGDSTDIPQLKKADVELCFRFEKDTLKYKFNINHAEKLKHVSYHGYYRSPYNDELCMGVLSEQSEGLTEEDEVWKYRMFGFKNTFMPTDSVTVLKKPDFKYYKSDGVKEEDYIPIFIKEQLVDYVGILREEDWFKKFSRAIDLRCYDSTEVYEAFYSSYIPKKFKDKLIIDSEEYRLGLNIDQSKDGNRYFFLYGKEKGNKIVNKTQLICYNSDSSEVEYWFDLSNYLRAKNQEVMWLHQIDSVLYLATSNELTAEENNGINGFITAIDTKNNDVLWQSKSLVANAMNFEIIGDILVTGYGHEKEKCSVNFINIKNGKVVDTLKLKSKPLWFAYYYDVLYLRTQESNYEFSVESSFFKKL